MLLFLSKLLDFFINHLDKKYFDYFNLSFYPYLAYLLNEFSHFELLYDALIVNFANFKNLYYGLIF
jgi:hypothetical protein